MARKCRACGQPLSGEHAKGCPQEPAPCPNCQTMREALVEALNALQLATTPLAGDRQLNLIAQSVVRAALAAPVAAEPKWKCDACGAIVECPSQPFAHVRVVDQGNGRPLQVQCGPLFAAPVAALRERDDVYDDLDGKADSAAPVAPTPERVRELFTILGASDWLAHCDCDECKDRESRIAALRREMEV